MKMYYFLTMILGIMILLNLAGINTTTGYILNYLDIVDHPENLQSSHLYAVILAIFLTAVTGGIVIGFFTKSSPESYLIAPLAGILVLFVGDIISVITYVNSLGTSFVNYIILMVMSVIAFGYLISVVDWWRGLG